jgi:hypothetical protein
VLGAEIDNGGAPDLIAKIRRETGARPASAQPPLCGKCDNRWIYDDQDRAKHCPDCGPGSPAALDAGGQ